MSDTRVVDPVDDPTPTRRKAKPSGGLFRAFWRWHFYASFLVIPVLLVLAGTGLIYLLRFQVEPVLHGDLLKVDVPAGASRLSYDDQAAAVRKAYPDGRIASVVEPSAPDRSTDFTVSTATPGSREAEDATIREVYVDPYSGRVLGALDPDHTLSGWAKNTHKDMMLGTPGRYVLELGACWSIVMALTGYYLHWRGRTARARRRLAKARGAALRHRHATVGLAVGIGLLGLVVSGLPWTVWWGAKVQTLASSQGTSMWSADPGAQSSAPTLDASVPHSHNVPWGSGRSPVPSSAPEQEGASPVGVDYAIGAAERRGLSHPMTVVLPADATGVYSVMGYAFHAPSREATVHVDQFTGQPVAQYGYGDYSALAKVVDQGIALHEGRRFGSLNLAVSAAFCLAVIFLCLAGPLMWWRRRPRGSSLGAPRGRLDVRTGPFAVAGLAGLALVLPVFGASLVAVFALDQLVLRRVTPLKNFFNVA
ncbi:PepSY-associated TM helix domain-containing protein [Nocardioides jiangxiensis]|uniref:PepSY domain-containing protein n=1 Tax=Nocardioides jiangxiensis TaxID=3064524 RepID=A0ABT9B0W7_9ACTN|nr:PepSY domain-containing protein [Nocardioides sp. WY-20]MDO7868313.1 PepSY domain-containing protein [Nocardioides sp. WY-20]